MAVNDVVVSYNALIDRWNSLAADLRVVHRHLRAGRVSRALQVLVELLDSLDGLSDGESGDESGESAAPANADGSGDISDGGESGEGDGNAPAALAGPLATLPAGALPEGADFGADGRASRCCARRAARVYRPQFSA